ncbi:hypothetical protein BAUCODRAFT_31302 [Baudoinia panamericana UAMH 10762]|uniref:Uncharacterized protein n=1 Tax=Baudoinia panamericana (strain UAMH 10762) TaxID=717646 RepID=M2MQG9_BAUPA|nr:uncharacterized protein BAUCODRAFT_31302 [Baudoinia panamericana UAMH 10762]EMC99021.1 hypothetical protein BAUCODRAFT_31302 [Baudoinia panamericana UAMH 10762]
MATHVTANFPQHHRVARPAGRLIASLLALGRPGSAFIQTMHTRKGKAWSDSATSSLTRSMSASFGYPW